MISSARESAAFQDVSHRVETHIDLSIPYLAAQYNVRHHRRLFDVYVVSTLVSQEPDKYGGKEVFIHHESLVRERLQLFEEALQEAHNPCMDLMPILAVCVWFVL